MKRFLPVDMRTDRTNLPFSVKKTGDKLVVLFVYSRNKLLAAQVLVSVRMKVLAPELQERTCCLAYSQS